MPLAALASGSAGAARVAGEREQLLEGLHAEVADPLQQRVQHLDGGPRVGQRAVGRPGRGAEQLGQRAEPDAGRLVAGEHPAGQPGGAEHGRPRPALAVPLARRAQEAGVERGVVRDQHRAAQELQHASAAPRRAAARRPPSPW